MGKQQAKQNRAGMPTFTMKITEAQSATTVAFAIPYKGNPTAAVTIACPYPITQLGDNRHLGQYEAAH